VEASIYWDRGVSPSSSSGFTQLRAKLTRVTEYTPADFVSLVKRYNISYHEKKPGQLFCDGSSAEIIEMLLTEAADAGVQIRCRSLIRAVRAADARSNEDLEPVNTGEFAHALTPKATLFEVETGKGIITARSLVVATGGLSIQPLGATDFGYRLATGNQDSASLSISCLIMTH
jgi:predicted flavoprotein YhiN